MVPSKYNSRILEIAHALPISGHLGVKKTQDRILQHFCWPKLRRSVTQFVKLCHVCWVLAKPNQDLKLASLSPVSALMNRLAG